MDALDNGIYFCLWIAFANKNSIIFDERVNTYFYMQNDYLRSPTYFIIYCYTVGLTCLSTQETKINLKPITKPVPPPMLRHLPVCFLLEDTLAAGG